METLIQIGNRQNRVFLQDGFYHFSSRTNRLHKHNYTEFHIVKTGSACLTTDKATYSLQKGDVVAIPAGCYHCYKDYDPDTISCAFQTDATILEPTMHHTSMHTINELFSEIENCQKSEDYTKVSLYLSLLLNPFFPKQMIQAIPIDDDSFIICEFFSRNYTKNITLKDLAKVLHVSEKQTERLVKKHTGRSFKEELIFHRMKIARILAKEGTMSMAEIADYVGYQSYSGFWKAWKGCEK